MFRRIGAHCHSGDVDLAKSLARNIMYYEYKIDYNSPIPIVHEAEVISKETRKKHGSHEKAKAFEDLSTHGQQPVVLCVDTNMSETSSNVIKEALH